MVNDCSASTYSIFFGLIDIEAQISGYGPVSLKGYINHPLLSGRKLLRMGAGNSVGPVLSHFNASNFIARIEPIQISRIVSFRKISTHGFGSALSGDGRQEEVIILE